MKNNNAQRWGKFLHGEGSLRSVYQGIERHVTTSVRRIIANREGERRQSQNDTNSSIFFVLREISTRNTGFTVSPTLPMAPILSGLGSRRGLVRELPNRLLRRGLRGNERLSLNGNSESSDLRQARHLHPAILHTVSQRNGGQNPTLAHEVSHRKVPGEESTGIPEIG